MQKQLRVIALIVLAGLAACGGRTNCGIETRCKAAPPPCVAAPPVSDTPDAPREIDATGRPTAWAEPLRKDGLPNLHKVSDALYRGAQPTAAGFAELKKMGVKTVVSLRSFHSDRAAIGETGLAYEHIYMKAWHPEDKEVVRFLAIVGDESRHPVFVHCQHGADRTGTMCALYRIAVQGWDRERAIDEMVNGGFGFHKIWQNLTRYVRNLDIDDIAARAGLKERPEPPVAE